MLWLSWRFVGLWALVGALGLCAAGAMAREWTSGTFKIEAEFVEVKGEKAVLRKPDGKLVEIQISKLSQADQDFIKKSDPNAKSMPVEDDGGFGSVEGLPPPEILSGGKSKSSTKPATGSSDTKEGEGAAGDAVPAPPKFVKITYSDPTFVGIVRTLKPYDFASSWYTSAVFSPEGGWIAIGGGG